MIKLWNVSLSKTTGDLVGNFPPNSINPEHSQARSLGASEILLQNHPQQLLLESSAAKEELGQCSGVSCPVLLLQAGSREDVNEDIRGIVPKMLEEIEWGYNLFKSTEHTKYCGTRSSGGKRFGKKAEGTIYAAGTAVAALQSRNPSSNLCGLLNHS